MKIILFSDRLIKKIVFCLAMLGWSFSNIASAAIINQPMTGATAPGWVIGGSAYLTASAGIDPVGSGWLRLTDAANLQAGYAYFDTAFDISQGVTILYDYVTWGGNGADGYSIYLFDASASPFSVGACGGSLGYAQKNATSDCPNPGLSLGSLGVGVDDYGNYSNPTEGRIGGPGAFANEVSVRGPYNHPSGAYYWIGGNTAIAQSLSFSNQSFRPSQAGPQYRKVIIYMTPVAAPNYMRVDVYIQFGYNQPWTAVVTGLMISRPAPSSVKVGYAASTGGLNNNHEIRNLQVNTLCSGGIDLSMTKLASSPTVTQGGPLTYTVIARNNGPNNVTASNVPITDTVPAQLTGVTWTCAGSGGAVCGAASGSGNTINTFATLPYNGAATYTITGTINPSTLVGTQITNTATLTVPVGITDCNPNDKSSSVTTTVVGPSFSISGMVYSDANHNGVRDGGEGSSNIAAIYAKLFLSSDQTTALQVVAVNQAAGTYTFTNVPSGNTYTIILSSDNSTSYTPSFPNANWIYTSPINYTLSNVVVTNANLTNQNFGVYNGSRIDGRVFNDNGANGSIANANDGIQNASETGLSGVAISLTNASGGTTYDTTTTDSAGNFSLFTNTSSKTLRVNETNPTGYVSVSYNAGNTAGTYTIASDYISFAYTLYTDYSGIRFGDVPDNTFLPTTSAVNGSSLLPVYYAHTFTPGTGGNVSFAVASRTQGTWPAIALYQDTNCNGVYDGADIALPASLVATAGVPICILVKDTVPVGAGAGTTDQIVTRATFTFTNSIGPVVRTYNVTDTTTVVAAPSLTVLKSVQTFSDPFNNTTNPKAIPGAVMLYTVIVTNSGSGAVDSNSLAITDPIPANTAMCVSNICSNPPVTFVCSTTPPCGLTFNYASAVTYSNHSGGVAPFNYTPVPDANGYDANVTGVRINPSGILNGAGGGNPSFTTYFRVRVN